MVEHLPSKQGMLVRFRRDSNQLGSSMVEQSAVNRKVVGSSPILDAMLCSLTVKHPAHNRRDAGSIPARARYAKDKNQNGVAQW